MKCLATILILSPWSNLAAVASAQASAEGPAADRALAESAHDTTLHGAAMGFATGASAATSAAGLAGFAGFAGLASLSLPAVGTVIAIGSIGGAVSGAIMGSRSSTVEEAQQAGFFAGVVTGYTAPLALPIMGFVRAYIPAALSTSTATAAANYAIRADCFSSTVPECVGKVAANYITGQDVSGWLESKKGSRVWDDDSVHRLVTNGEKGFDAAHKLDVGFIHKTMKALCATAGADAVCTDEMFANLKTAATMACNFKRKTSLMNQGTLSREVQALLKEESTMDAYWERLGGGCDGIGSNGRVHYHADSDRCQEWKISKILDGKAEAVGRSDSGLRALAIKATEMREALSCLSDLSMPAGDKLVPAHILSALTANVDTVDRFLGPYYAGARWWLS